MRTGAPIDCLYVGFLHDYGRVERDVSHEFLNICAGLSEHPRLVTRVFFPDIEARLHGVEGMRERFRDLARTKPPELVMHVPYTEEFSPPLDVMADLTRRGVATVEWDADSSWRFDEFVRPRIAAYALFVTTHAATVPRYIDAGARVHLSQWAASSHYRGFEPGADRPVAVSFVGQRHGDRREVVRALRRARIPVETWGAKWRKGLFPDRRDHGYVPYRDALAAIGRSVVSLNLSNASASNAGNQIKGRHFEIAALGACQVTTPTDDLEQFFEPGKEIVVAESGEPMRDAVAALLRDRGRARGIAESGYRRAWSAHTWERRIDGILEALGIT